jgi:hypothetical protein
MLKRKKPDARMLIIEKEAEFDRNNHRGAARP